MDHSQNERERLAELYTGMDEVELRELAQDAGSLTDAARETLKAGLSKRKLDVALEYPAEKADEPPHPELVTLRQFRDIPAALLAKSVLDSEGIECFLADENIIPHGLALVKPPWRSKALGEGGRCGKSFGVARTKISRRI